jgi:hypothetical protein
MTITKFDVAEREIIAAVQLLFDGGDPIPIYALANSAREISATLREKRGSKGVVGWVQVDHPHMTREHAALFKHADKDPDGVLEDFDAIDADAVLHMACTDFKNLRRLPIEGDAFDHWFLGVQGFLEGLDFRHVEGIRGITSVPRDEQLAMGKRFLNAARARGHL